MSLAGIGSREDDLPQWRNQREQDAHARAVRPQRDILHALERPMPVLGRPALVLEPRARAATPAPHAARLLRLTRGGRRLIRGGRRAGVLLLL